jgi:hypothetical protein
MPIIFLALYLFVSTAQAEPTPAAFLYAHFTLQAWNPDLNVPDPAHLAIHISGDGCDAIYFDGDLYLEKGSSRCRAPQGNASLLIHEYAHFVEAALTDSVIDQSMHEAFADIISAFVLDDPKIGNHFYQEEPTWIRDLSHPYFTPDQATGIYTKAMNVGSLWWKLYEKLKAEYPEKSVTIRAALTRAALHSISRNEISFHLNALNYLQNDSSVKSLPHAYCAAAELFFNSNFLQELPVQCLLFHILPVENKGPTRAVITENGFYQDLVVKVSCPENTFYIRGMDETPIMGLPANCDIQVHDDLPGQTRTFVIKTYSN